jgi:hypothetical protein
LHKKSNCDRLDNGLQIVSVRNPNKRWPVKKFEQTETEMAGIGAILLSFIVDLLSVIWRGLPILCLRLIGPVAMIVGIGLYFLIAVMANIAIERPELWFRVPGFMMMFLLIVFGAYVIFRGSLWVSDCLRQQLRRNGYG